MSRYPMFPPPLFPGTHVGLDGPSSEQYSLHCANTCVKATKQAQVELEAEDRDPLDDLASSSGAGPLASSLNGAQGPHSSSLTDSDKPAYDEDEVLPSKFTDKLNTNYIPSLPEISEINQYVSTIDMKLTAYDTRIADLEATLHEMHRKRRQLQELTTAHKALSSPFRRLPPEILQVIFVWCLPHTRNAVMHSSEAPVLLGRVCSEWRRISLATPELWSSLHIVPPNVNFANPGSSLVRFQRKRDLIKMWLDRSGACPISVSMVWFAGDSEEEISLCGTLLDVLVPLCARWQSLDFQVPLKMFKPFVGLNVVDVPALEGLTLMDNRTPTDMDLTTQWPESLNFAENAKKLRTFTLTFFSGGIKLPSIPWSQLTTLYLESNISFFFADGNEMLEVLGRCANLVNCTLKFPLSHTAPLAGYERLYMTTTLPQLEVLCLDGDQHLMNTFHMNNTLTNIIAPKLRRLEILGRANRPVDGSGSSNNNDIPEPLSAIKELFGKSRCPLEKLNLESMTMIPEEFIACLRLVPTLDELVVHNWTARVFTPTIGNFAGMAATSQEEEGQDGKAILDAMDIAENRILKALTVSKSEDDFDVVIKPKKQVVEDSALAEDGSSSVGPVVPESDTRSKGEMNEKLGDDEFPSKSQSSATPNLDLDLPFDLDFFDGLSTPLLPNLQKFDFTLCDASQHLLCNFIASRFDKPPEGVRKLKSVKSNFTAIQKDEVYEKMQRYKAGGLDLSVIYQVPMSDELNPSPWTGLEGPP